MIWRLLTFAFILVSCSNKKDLAEQASQPAISFKVLDARLPLKLGEVNLADQRNAISLNDEINERIRLTVSNYCKEYCVDDSLHSYQDNYISTLRFHDQFYTVFLVLLKQFPTGYVNSKILFYDDKQKEFIDGDFDFNLWALYSLEGDKLRPSNLKSALKMNSPEIEIVDHDKNGVGDYKFVRLFHNGTFNSLRTIIVSPARSKIDTLLFKEEPR